LPTPRPALVLAAVLAIGLAFSCRAAEPKAAHVLEFALVAEGQPAAIELDYTPRGGIPARVSLEQPKRFAVARAEMTHEPSTGDAAVSVEFEHEAGVQFEHWTALNLERRLAVLLDRHVMMVATIQGALSGQAVFLRASPPFTVDEVREVVASLNADH
jgi:preprotein translocase subunit SecD